MPRRADPLPGFAEHLEEHRDFSDATITVTLSQVRRMLRLVDEHRANPTVPSEMDALLAHVPRGSRTGLRYAWNLYAEFKGPEEAAPIPGRTRGRKRRNAPGHEAPPMPPDVETIVAGVLSDMQRVRPGAGLPKLLAARWDVTTLPKNNDQMPPQHRATARPNVVYLDSDNHPVPLPLDALTRLLAWGYPDGCLPSDLLLPRAPGESGATRPLEPRDVKLLQRRVTRRLREDPEAARAYRSCLVERNTPTGMEGLELSDDLDDEEYMRRWMERKRCEAARNAGQ